MIYTIEKAKLIDEQLRKFTDGYTHHVAGHFGNIDFWLEEVAQALKVIDNYSLRFKTLSHSQSEWVETHNTVVHEYCEACKGRCEFSDGIPSLPRRKMDDEQLMIRKQLVDRTYFFLIRCYKMGLLDDSTLKEKCDYVGTSIDPKDLVSN